MIFLGDSLTLKWWKPLGDIVHPMYWCTYWGRQKTCRKKPQYTNVVQEVLYYFSEKIQQAYNNGINDVIIDPGFGFGKTLEHNYTLMKHLDLFQSLELPILVGISRKSMIYKKTGHYIRWGTQWNHRTQHLCPVQRSKYSSSSWCQASQRMCRFIASTPIVL